MLAGRDFVHVMLESNDAKTKHLYQYLTAICEGTLPLTACETDWYRDLVDHLPALTYRYTKEVMLKLVCIVRKKLARQMKDALVGALMFDTWSHGNCHYVGVIAKYMHNGNVASSLLSCSPLTGDLLPEAERPQGPPTPESLNNLANNERAEAIRFDARTYADFIEDLFLALGVSIWHWLLCCITDNASVMAAVAHLLMVYHIGCKNHALHLCVDEALPIQAAPAVIERHVNRDIIMVLRKVWLVMKKLKNGHIANAYLRTLTHLRPHVMVPQR